MKLTDVGKTDPVTVSLRFQNKSVAPFPYNWPVEFSALPLGGGSATVLGSADVKLKEMRPAWMRPTRLRMSGSFRLRTACLRVKNPLDGGKPLRFANATQDQHQPGALTLGTFTVR